MHSILSVSMETPSSSSSFIATAATDNLAPSDPSSDPASDSSAKKSMLIDVPVDSPNAALNLMIAFLTVAQKRGAFSIPESAKLWECIGVFTKPQQEEGFAKPQQEADQSTA